MFIQNQWYIAALSGEVAEQPLGRTICGEQIVLYRAGDGQVAALPDRCPHRQAPLSKGRLVNGNLQCPYHGMEFSAQGTCVHIPSQSVIPQRAHLPAYAAVEHYGLVWVWIGEEPAGELPNISELSDLVSESHAGTMVYMYAKTDYRLGVDNFLDASHVLFVHPNTVASEAVTTASTETLTKGDEVRVRRVMPGEACSPLFKQILKSDTMDRVQDSVFRPVGNTWIETTVTLPNVKDGPTMRTRTFGLFTPETESTCHIWTGLYRDFDIGNEKLGEIIARQIVQTVEEDIAICEAVQRNWDDHTAVVHLVADQGGLAARGVLRKLGRVEVNPAVVMNFNQLEQTAQ
jgi:phenylpropionate dioxygenase-like ring-hydroxylating dioxygenase large terminal subunit